MLGDRNKRKFLYLKTRKYKLKKFVRNNNNTINKENLKLQKAEHIEKVINKLQNNAKKAFKDKEKQIYNEALFKQQHINAVIDKINKINDKREYQEELIFNEKLDNLANGAINTVLEDKNKESELSFNESFDSTASTTDEQSEDNEVSVPYVDKYISNNYAIFNHANHKKQNDNTNISIWRQNDRKDKNKGIEQFTKPIKNDKPVKLFLGSGFSNEISTTDAEKEKNMFLKDILHNADLANKKIKKANNTKPIKLFLSSGRASHHTKFE